MPIQDVTSIKYYLYVGGVGHAPSILDTKCHYSINVVSPTYKVIHACCCSFLLPSGSLGCRSLNSLCFNSFIYRALQVDVCTRTGVAIRIMEFVDYMY